MAYYLVSAMPHADRIEELQARLANAFVTLQPFGRALSDSLRNARRRPDGMALWEEEDYCRPPLAQERAAVLDHYFDPSRRSAEFASHLVGSVGIAAAGRSGSTAAALRRRVSMVCAPGCAAP